MPNGKVVTFLRPRLALHPGTSSIRADMDPSDLSTALEALETADPVAFRVYCRRNPVSGKAPILEQLGDEFGVSRERVRQLEKRFGYRLKHIIVDEPDHPISQASKFLRVRLGVLAQVTDIPSAVGDLDMGPVTDPMSDNRLLILLNLAGPYEVRGTWCTQPEALSKADHLLKQMMEIAYVPLVDAIQVLVSAGASAENAAAWLSEQQGYLILEGHVVLRGHSLADRGVSVLSVRGEPMTLEEIFALLKEKRNFIGFKKQMQGDERVVRRGLKHYGLREWGDESYTTIVEEMTQEIMRRGGSVDLDKLAESLAEQFGVQRSSVRAYARTARFSVDRNGRVSVPSSPKPEGGK